LEVVRDIDIRPLLPQIHTRTLVVHKTHDRMLTVEASRYLATHMPNARFVELSGADHFFFVESKQVVAAVKEFCREKSESPPDTMLGIVLYVTIPTMKQKEKAVQREFKEHRAIGIFFSSEEATAVFDSPSRAIQCALKLRDLIKDESLKIGLHVGECDAENAKPSVAVVAAVRRAVEFAPQMKVLLTQTLRDILAGSGVVFDVTGIHLDKKKAESLSYYTLA
jgi:hypothetical protein